MDDDRLEHIEDDQASDESELYAVEHDESLKYGGTIVSHEGFLLWRAFTRLFVECFTKAPLIIYYNPILPYLNMVVKSS